MKSSKLQSRSFFLSFSLMAKADTIPCSKTMFGDPAEQSKHDADISLLDGELDEGYDPETQAILASVIQKDVSTSHPKPFDQYASTKSAHSLEVEEMQQVLKLRVIWKGEPRPDGAAKWSFLFRLVSLVAPEELGSGGFSPLEQTAPFRRLHEMMQAKTGMSESDIVLVYDDQRIMLGGTPKSLRMRKDTTEEISQHCFLKTCPISADFVQSSIQRVNGNS